MRDAVRKRHPEFRGKTVYLYCPTFREAGGKQVRYDPRIDFAALSAALGEEEIFIVRRHPIMDYELLDGEFRSYAEDDSFPMKPQRIVYDTRIS